MRLSITYRTLWTAAVLCLLISTTGIAQDAAKDLTGSNVTCRNAGYRAGAEQSLEFVIDNASTDDEWINHLTLVFPAGVEVTGSTSFVGGNLGIYELIGNGATGDGAVVEWNGTTGPPDEYGVVWGGRSAYGVVNVSIAPGYTGDLAVDFTVAGDLWGAEPHSASGSLVLTASPASPSVTITSPNDGPTWPLGETRSLTWDAPGLDVVTIEVMRVIQGDLANSVVWDTLAVDLPNTGAYDWTVDEPWSFWSVLRVSGDGGSAADVTDRMLTLWTQPTLEITRPNGGDFLLTTNSIYVLNQSTMVQRLDLELSRDGGLTWTPMVDGASVYSAIIPAPGGPASSNCLVRATSIDGSVTDVSDAPFSIVDPFIDVLAPNGGEVVHIGSPREITWQAALNGSLEIDLSRDGFVTWENIAQSEPNDGAYTWTPTGPPSTNCWIRIFSLGGDPEDFSAQSFTLADPYVQVLAPNGGERHVVGVPVHIQWDSDLTTDVHVDLSRDDGLTWTTLDADHPNDGSMHWIASPPVSDACLIRVMAADSSRIDVSDAPFTIWEPNVQVVTPNGGETYRTHDAVHVQWSAELDSTVSIDLSFDGGSTWDRLADDEPNDGSWIWIALGFPAGSSDCLIKVSDIDGEPFDVSDAPFTLEWVPEEIFLQSPDIIDLWFIGDDHDIIWQPAGSDDVIIEASIDDGATWRTVIESTPNDGSFTWTVDAPASPTTMIRISTLDGLYSGATWGTFVVMWPDAVSFTPSVLDYGVIPFPDNDNWEWNDVRMTFTAHNSCPDTLRLVPGLVSEVFHLDPSFADMLAIPPMDSVACEVTFGARWPGVHAESIWFMVGRDAPATIPVDVDLIGIAAEWPCAMYDIPFFGEVAVGDTVVMTSTITNQTGDDYSLLEGDPIWSGGYDDDGQYAVIDGGGPYALAQGESHTVTIRFTPNVPGEHWAFLDLQHPTNEGCMNEPVECLGFATLDFDAVDVGAAVDDTLTLLNSSPEPLNGNLALAGAAKSASSDATPNCQVFDLVSGGGDYTLDPGASLTYVVRYQPDEIGAHSCAVETGRGAFTLLGAATDATGLDPETLPPAFALHACVPNPFNPSTTISFDLPVASSVRLCVYDVSGNVVRRLIDGELIAAGRHEAVWAGRNDAGQPSAAGVYLYRLEVEDFLETKRMVLVK